MVDLCTLSAIGVATGYENRASRTNAQVSLYPWKDTPDNIPLAVRHIRTFLRAHRTAAAAQWTCVGLVERH